MSYKYKQLKLVSSKLELPDINQTYLDDIPEDLAFVIFTFVDNKHDFDSIIQYKPFSSVLKNPYNWVNKLKLNYPVINIKFLDLLERFTSYNLVNVAEYNRLKQIADDILIKIDSNKNIE